MNLLLKITGSLLLSIIAAYLIVLIMKFLMSWIRLPYHRLNEWIDKLASPVEKFTKKYLPIRIGVIDFSMYTPIFMLIIFMKLIIDFMISGRTFSYIRIVYYLLELIIYIIDNAFIFIAGIIFIFTLILFIKETYLPYTHSPFLNMIKTVINPILIQLKKIIRIKTNNPDRDYLLILLILILLTGVIGHLLLCSGYWTMYRLSNTKIQIHTPGNLF